MTKKIITALNTIKLVKNWPVYFKDYFGMVNNNKITYQLRNGVKYVLRPGTTDRFIINEIWIHNTYTPKNFEIQKNDIIIDIGGHIGVFSVMAANKASEGKVYAFEPVSNNFDLLEENKKINGLKNLFITNAAVSNKTGKRKLFVSGNKNKGNNSFYKMSNDSKEISTNTVGIANILKNHGIKKVDFLKMDCEGGEYDILYKSPKKTLKKIDKISMEYHNINDIKNGVELKKFLEKNGFDVIMKEEPKKGRIYARRLI